jgi:hypothetical protein
MASTLAAVTPSLGAEALGLGVMGTHGVSQQEEALVPPGPRRHRRAAGLGRRWIGRSAGAMGQGLALPTQGCPLDPRAGFGILGAQQGRPIAPGVLHRGIDAAGG